MEQLALLQQQAQQEQEAQHTQHTPLSSSPHPPPVEQFPQPHIQQKQQDHLQQQQQQLQLSAAKAERPRREVYASFFSGFHEVLAMCYHTVHQVSGTRGGGLL